MRIRVLMLLVALLVLFAPAGDSLMTYHGPDDGMPVSGGWPEVLSDLVRTDTRVLGAVGPFVDVRIYCVGETAELNVFLKDYAEVPDARLRVVLHPGSRTVKYESHETDRVTGETVLKEYVVDFNWSLHIGDYAEFRPDKSDFEGNKFITTLDIWLGGQIELDRLEVPPSIHMESSGEMEKFINRHEERRNPK